MGFSAQGLRLSSDIQLCIVLYMNTVEKYLEWAGRRLQVSDGTAKQVREMATKWRTLASAEPSRGALSAFLEYAEGETSAPREGLERSAVRVAELENQLADARAAQRDAIRVASVTGMPETQIARSANVARATVRAALGK